MKRFEYFLLGKELKSQTDIATRQHQELDNALIPNKDNKYVNKSLVKREKKNSNSKSNLIYNRFSFKIIVTTKNLIGFLLNQNIYIH